ncbi:MAG: hypothetical protein ACE5Z5_10330 [Candidatus Bathyarchaeia archaeon]
MGRITPSFRQLFMREVERLRKGFRPTLTDPEHQRALDGLIRAWSGESAAMMMSNIPATLDAMNLLANVHTRAEMERLERRLEELEGRMAQLQKQTSIGGEKPLGS